MVFYTSKSKPYDMATTAVIGLSAGKRLLSSSFYYSDLSDKLPYGSEVGFSHHHQVSSAKNVIMAKKSSSSSSNYTPSFISNRDTQHSIKAVKEHAGTISSADPSNLESWHQRYKEEEGEVENIDPELSLEALLLLQKSMLEKQWKLSTEQTTVTAEKARKKSMHHVTSSGTSARRRRMGTRTRAAMNRTSCNSTIRPSTDKQMRSTISPELVQNRSKGYVKGVISDELLTHTEVVQLSKKIKTGLYLEERKSRLKERLGCEPSEQQIATSLRISCLELQSKLMECNLAREKLAMSNVRLVMSIAQRYDSMGAQMGDLVQGGLIGLLRGIEKFDSSKGFKISTYVYWWIRQGVSRALVDNSGTLRLPIYLHERLSLIRNAKNRLEQKGITPTIEKIAESLNMSEKKVRNATEAIDKVFSLDREAFPSLNGIPGETLHSYIADDRLENIPWHGVHEWALKDEVNKLINTTLREREREIIRLYYGLDYECLTWEDISKRMGLSRERVRQVGLVAVEKLKHAARKRRLDAMLVDY
ncbi:hypothetical protein LguiA_031653 [Lonicera macranthoides]